jgi:mRNA interferase YafQ
MRQLESTHAFKRDLKRELAGQYKKVVTTQLAAIIQQLQLDEPLAARLRDHALTGQWSDHRDCHIKPDLVLIYRKPDSVSLQLVRLGSHSELGI